MSDERKKLEEAAQKLAKATEQSLRDVNWRTLIDSLIDDVGFTDGALAFSAGLLALIIPNLKDLLEVIDLLPLKIGVLLVLASAVCGLVSKSLRKRISTSTAKESPEGVEYIAIIEKHTTAFAKLAKEASQLGIELKDPVDYAQMVGPALENHPAAGRAVIKEALRDDSDERKWRSAHRMANACSSIVFLQGYVLAIAVAVLLFSLREPKVSSPTDGAHTSAARR